MPRSVVGRVADGMQYAGMPIEFLQTGSVFFVSNSTVLPRNGIAGSDGNDGKTPEKPKATLAGALAQCLANRGDTIILMQGHAETLTASLAVSIAGVKIVGLGVDTDRPTFTLATNAAAGLSLSGANVSLYNVLIVANTAATAAVKLAGIGVQVANVEVRDGSGSVVSAFSVLGGGANLADKVGIVSCKASSAGATQAVLIGEVDDLVEIMDNDFVGSFSSAVIQNPSSKVLTQLRLHRNNLVNTNASGLGINMLSACTGSAIDNRINVNTYGNELISGGALDLVDNIAANSVSGSFLVPLPTIGTQIPAVSAIKPLPQSATVTVATITGGPVRIKFLAAEVTTVVQAQADNLKFSCIDTASSTTNDICAVANISAAAVGTFLWAKLDAAATALQINAGGTSGFGAGSVVAPTGTLVATTSASNTGNIKYHIQWEPLQPGATLVLS